MVLQEGVKLGRDPVVLLLDPGGAENLRLMPPVGKVSHGDPDYSIDSLTEVGRKEAEFLAERLAAVETAPASSPEPGRRSP